MTVKKLEEFDEEQQEEIKKWNSQRAKNYPTKKIQEQKEANNTLLLKKGIEKKDRLSQLEIKLKKKIRILNSLDDKNFSKK